uniref:Uncharacterized protein n=1 Tax=viral metagenome TaxID=1070528 RepID=A0A6C0IWI7_9ZZZZ
MQAINLSALTVPQLQMKVPSDLKKEQLIMYASARNPPRRFRRSPLSS